jgi:hypothetical protein
MKLIQETINHRGILIHVRNHPPSPFWGAWVDLADLAPGDGSYLWAGDEDKERVIELIKLKIDFLIEFGE